MRIIGIILGLILIFSLETSLSQVYVNGKNINENLDLEYIELIVDRRAFNQGQVFAVVDYGQIIRAFTWRQHRIKDEKGEDKRFNSEMDIFNFLFKNGWNHDITYTAETAVFHIFRCKKIIGSDRRE
jgi:hypothetical protein